VPNSRQPAPPRGGRGRDASSSGGSSSPFATAQRRGYDGPRDSASVAAARRSFPRGNDNDRDRGSPFGKPGDLNLSGAARRMREKALREAGLQMSGDPMPAASAERRPRREEGAESSGGGGDDAPRRERAPRESAPPPWARAEGSAGRGSAIAGRGGAGRGGAGGRGAGRGSRFAAPVQPKPWERPEVRAAAEAAVAADAAEPALPLPSNPGHANPFVRLGLSRAAGEALTEAGMTVPTPIQTLALPKLLSGSSAALLAETGSGKTLTYCLPLLTRLYARATSRKGVRRTPNCACPELLLIVPTRELGVQVAAAAEAAAMWCAPDNVERPASVLALLGKDKSAVRLATKAPPRRDFASAGATAAAKEAGAKAPRVSAKPKLDAPDAEARAAFQSADVVVATPRAALDLFNGERLRLDRLRAIVVDEADELLAPGCVDTPPDTPQHRLHCAHAKRIALFLRTDSRRMCVR
jgi:hypothetical protein